MGMGILGMGASLFGQNQTNKMQQQMMQQQQSFQEQMSSTAYQRASKDMTAAGLNPMMMFSSGSAASSPAGAAPSAQVKSGLDADSMQKMISTAVNAKVANATIDNLVEQNAKIKAEAATERWRPDLVASQTGVNRNTIPILRERERLTKHAATVEESAAERAKNELAINSTVRRLLDQAGYGGKKVDEILSPVSNIVSSAKRAKSLFDERWP